MLDDIEQSVQAEIEALRAEEAEIEEIVEGIQEDVVDEDNVLQEEEVAEDEQWSEAELEAMDKGWKPEGVPGKRHVTAEEFLDKEPLFEEIHRLRREQKRHADQIEAMKAMNEHAQTLAYNKAMAELKEQRKAAFEEGDGDAFDKIETQMEELRTSKDKVDKVSKEESQWNLGHSQQEWASAVDNFMKTNTWYNANADMREEADDFSMKLLKADPDMSPNEVLDKTLSRMHRLFPETFQNTARKRPAAVSAPAKTVAKTGAARKAAFADLDSETRQVGRQLIRSGLYKDEEAYVNSLIENNLI